MLRPSKLNFITSICLCLPQVALAQDQNETVVDEIIVTSTRIATAKDELGSSVTVISGDELIQQQEFIVADALRGLSGVSLSRSGGLGGVTNVRLRGADAGQTIVLINGIKINDLSAPSGGTNFANMGTSNISRIELLKGPQSTLYGSDAMGGVIAIDSFSPLQEGENSLSFYGEAGSFNTKRTGGALGFNRQMFEGHMSVDYIGSDNISAADENAGNSERDPYDNLTIMGQVTAHLVDTSETQASVQGFVRHAKSNINFDKYDFVLGYVDGDEKEDVTDKQFGLKLKLILLGKRFKNSVNIYWSGIDRHDFEGGTKSFEAFSKRQNFEYLGQYKASEMLDLLLGGEIEKNDIISESFGPWASREVGSADIKSLFGDAKFNPVENLSLSMGVRLDDHETFGNHTSFRATAAYKLPATDTLVRANYGDGFRAPSLYQLFSAYGDTSLLPEVSHAWEVGFEQGFDVAAGLTVDVSYFDSKTDHQINFDLGTYKYANIDKTHVRGIEITSRLSLSQKIEISANYTHLNAKDVGTGLPLLRRPKNSFNMAVNIAWSEVFSSGARLTHVGAQPDSAGPLPSFSVVDVTSSYLLREGVEFYGRIENLLNKEYQEVTGFGTPDRAAYIGLRLKL